MSDHRLLWLAIGAGAAYLLFSGAGGGAGANARFSISLGGGVNAQVPPDQSWAKPVEDRTQIGVWDPMGTPTWYKNIVQDSSGNKVFSGGGIQ